MKLLKIIGNTASNTSMVENQQVLRNEEPLDDGVNGEQVNDISGGETQEFGVDNQSDDDNGDNEHGFEDTEEIAREILLHSQDIICDSRPILCDEESMITSFLEKTCGCKLSPVNHPCSSKFSKESIQSSRDSCAELSHNELDILIMAQLKSGTDKNNRTTFYHNGIAICRATFFLLHGISRKKFYNIKKSFSKNGLMPRIHGNTKRTPHNTLSFSAVQSVVKFLLSYAEQNAVVFPEEFLDIADLMSNFCHPACRKGASGKSTCLLLKWSYVH